MADVARRNVSVLTPVYNSVKTQGVVNLGLPEDLDEAPGGIVGGARVADLACASRIVEGLQRLLDRGLGIEGVCQVQVEVVGLQAVQGGIARLVKIPAR